MNRKRNIQFDPSGGPASPPAAEVVAVEPVAEVVTPVVEPVLLSADDHWAEAERILKGAPAEPVVPAAVEPVVKTDEEIAAEKVIADAAVVEPVITDDSAEIVDDLEVPALEIVEPVVNETWIEVANRIGVAPPVDPEDYDTFEKNVKQAIVDAEKRGEEKASAFDPDKHSPEEIQALNAFKGGVKIIDLVTPLQKYSDTLAMSDRDLVELNYKNTPGFTPEMVADQLAIIEQTPGMLEIEGTKLRNVVVQMRTNEYNEIIAKGEKAWQAESARQTQKIEKEKAELIAEINSRKEYMGAPLTDQHIEALVTNLNAGKYNKILNTAKSVADQILNHEFKDKRMSTLLANKEKAGKLAAAKKLANTPEETGGSHVEAEKKLIDPNDHFANVEEMMKGKKFTGSTYG